MAPWWLTSAPWWLTSVPRLSWWLFSVLMFRARFYDRFKFQHYFRVSSMAKIVRRQVWQSCSVSSSPQLPQFLWTRVHGSSLPGWWCEGEGEGEGEQVCMAAHSPMSTSKSWWWCGGGGRYESLELPGKSNQFENWCFLYLRKTKSWWCEGEEEEGGEEKVHLLTHGSTSGDCG